MTHPKPSTDWPDLLINIVVGVAVAGLVYAVTTFVLHNVPEPPQ